MNLFLVWELSSLMRWWLFTPNIISITLYLIMESVSEDLSFLFWHFSTKRSSNMCAVKVLLKENKWAQKVKQYASTTFNMWHTISLLKRNRCIWVLSLDAPHHSHPQSIWYQMWHCKKTCDWERWDGSIGWGSGVAIILSTGVLNLFLSGEGSLFQLKVTFPLLKCRLPQFLF